MSFLTQGYYRHPGPKVNTYLWIEQMGGLEYYLGMDEEPQKERNSGQKEQITVGAFLDPGRLIAKLIRGAEFPEKLGDFMFPLSTILGAAIIIAIYFGWPSTGLNRWGASPQGLFTAIVLGTLAFYAFRRKKVGKKAALIVSILILLGIVALLIIFSPRPF